MWSDETGAPMDASDAPPMAWWPDLTDSSTYSGSEMSDSGMSDPSLSDSDDGVWWGSEADTASYSEGDGEEMPPDMLDAAVEMDAPQPLQQAQAAAAAPSTALTAPSVSSASASNNALVAPSSPPLGGAQNDRDGVAIQWDVLGDLLQGRGALTAEAVHERPHRMVLTAARKIFVERPCVLRRAGGDKWLNSGGRKGSTLHWFDSRVGIRKRYGKVMLADGGAALRFTDFSLVKDQANPKEDTSARVFVVDGTHARAAPDLRLTKTKSEDTPQVVVATAPLAGDKMRAATRASDARAEWRHASRQGGFAIPAAGGARSGQTWGASDNQLGGAYVAPVSLPGAAVPATSGPLTSAADGLSEVDLNESVVAHAEAAARLGPLPLVSALCRKPFPSFPGCAPLTLACCPPLFLRSTWRWP